MVCPLKYYCCLCLNTGSVQTNGSMYEITNAEDICVVLSVRTLFCQIEQGLCWAHKARSQRSVDSGIAQCSDPHWGPFLSNSLLPSGGRLHPEANSPCAWRITASSQNRYILPCLHPGEQRVCLSQHSK